MTGLPCAAVHIREMINPKVFVETCRNDPQCISLALLILTQLPIWLLHSIGIFTVDMGPPILWIFGCDEASMVVMVLLDLGAGKVMVSNDEKS